jgi:hypothetical protein
MRRPVIKESPGAGTPGLVSKSNQVIDAMMRPPTEQQWISIFQNLFEAGSPLAILGEFDARFTARAYSETMANYARQTPEQCAALAARLVDGGDA